MEYCAPHPLQISIKKKIRFLARHGYEFKDATNGRILFTVENIPTFFNRKVIIYDHVGNSLVTFRLKAFTRRPRWEVYRRESKEKKDLIFSTRPSSAFQFTINLDVFLANNTTERVCDYKMMTNYMQTKCDIYVGQSSTLIAQMQNKITASTVFLGKDNSVVTVQPKVDQAFIFALMVILEEIITAANRVIVGNL